MAKARLNKLSDVLNAIDFGNTDYLGGLPDDKKADLSKNIWLMMRYCSGVKPNYRSDHSLHYLIMTHSLVNKDFMKVSDHPELQWKLMAHCGVGNKQYHELLPPTSSRRIDPKIKMLTSVFPEKKPDDIDLLIKINDVSELKEMCIDYGFETKDVNSAFTR